MKGIVLPLYSYNLTKLCRACLSPREKLTSIHDSHKVLNSNCSVSIAAMLGSITNIDVQTNENGQMPQEICQDCLDDIKNCYSFRLQLIYCDRYMRKLLSNQPELVDSPQIKTEEESMTKSETHEDILDSEEDNLNVEELLQFLSDLKRDEVFNDNSFSAPPLHHHEELDDLINECESTEIHMKISPHSKKLEGTQQKNSPQSRTNTKSPLQYSEDESEKNVFFSDSEDETLPYHQKLRRESMLWCHEHSRHEETKAFAKSSSKGKKLEKRKPKTCQNSNSKKSGYETSDTYPENRRVLHNSYENFQVCPVHSNDFSVSMRKFFMSYVRLHRRIECDRCHRKVRNLIEHQRRFCKLKSVI